ncbi:hypothetical protein [Paenarthrobacter sp. PH39-S1]|uniref:hypothetical protein n=1 Tax=Paenarthrobacter sp. PH39-S1 TaxID=3046204 RepID=UPI0024B8930F|nr:hypothetical protein [Paenarthrobacter sp. PH39-S1]MDJ0356628.1 hypothetical protein [Paenarthrobacter sp. PH39-S1]
MTTDKPGKTLPAHLANPIFWTDAEPARLQRDRTEVTGFASLLEYHAPDSSTDGGFIHGGWFGELPRWPFDRPAPEGLQELIGEKGLSVAVMYSAAHPMVPPTIFPVSIEPTFQEETQSAWHMAPGGSLCLLQSEGAWQPEASITELLAKAAGWRVEYALMKLGVIQSMSVRGIVSDPSFDHLVTASARTRQDPSASRERESAVVRC